MEVCSRYFAKAAGNLLTANVNCNRHTSSNIVCRFKYIIRFMKAEIKFYNIEILLNTIISHDRLQRTTVYATKMPGLVIRTVTYPRFVYLKVIGDDENSFCVIVFVSRFSSYLVS